MGNPCEWNKYRDKSWCYFDFDFYEICLNKTNMIEKNIICCYYSTEVEPRGHPSIHNTHTKAINGKIFPETSLINLAFSSG